MFRDHTDSAHNLHFVKLYVCVADVHAVKLAVACTPLHVWMNHMYKLCERTIRNHFWANRTMEL